MRTEGFFYNLDILYGGLGVGKLQFLIKKKFKKICSCNFFFNFWSLKPWIRIGFGSGFGSGSALASNIKLWIRIRKNEYGSTTLDFLDPGSEIRDPGWVKIRIRDKHPGCATLLKTILMTRYGYSTSNRVSF